MTKIDRRDLLRAGLAALAVSAVPRTALAQERIAPSFKLFDCHAHFYSAHPEKYPYRAAAAALGPEGMAKKAMEHPMNPETVFQIWDAAGIEKGLGVQYNSAYSTDDRYLLDISEQYPDRILPVVILDPVDGATPLMLEMLAKYRGIVGVRFTGVMMDGEFPFFSDLATGAWEVANDLGLNITLMPIRTIPQAMAKVAEFAARYPNVYIVLDHIGFPTPEVSPTFGLSPEHIALADHKNVYYKYTTLLIEQLQNAKVPTGPFLEHMVQTFGADQMVWGTDLGNSEGNIVDWVQAALRSAQGLAPQQRKAIFRDTAERVFIPGGHGAASA